jgi:hypothetical protein
VTMKNVVFWDVTTCGFVRTDVSEERIASFIRVERMRELVMLAITSWLLVIANVVSSSPILSTLIMETILSSETSVLIKSGRRHSSVAVWLIFYSS